MYQALYRKYRPATFDDVIGQSHITESLKHQVETDHLSHAYIFIGTRGTGKTTCARILAKAVNCLNTKNGNPCCECESCQSIADGSNMDIIELDAASNNGVDNVRALRDEAVFSPSNAKKRVYIIDEVHMLSTSAFNALLKILEEPPEHLIFILATTELQKVPATILSRCQRHTFKRIPTEQLAEYLESIAKKENINLTHEAALLLAGLGEGSVRDALSMLDQCSNSESIDVDDVYNSVGLAGNKRISNLFSSISSQNSTDAISMFGTMWNEGKDPAIVLKELSNLTRDVLMMKVAPSSAENLIYGGYEIADLQKFASSLTTKQLCDISDEIQKTLANLTNPKMNAELCIIKLANLTNPEFIVREAAPFKEAADVKAPVKNQSSTVVKQEHINIMPQQQIPSVNSDAKQDLKTQNVMSTNDASVENDAESADFWFNVCSGAKQNIPMDIAIQLNNSNVVTGYLDGDMLNIVVSMPFLLDRMNRSEITNEFSKVASQVAGRNITTRVTAKKNQSANQNTHSIDELKNFSEINFL